MFDLSFVEGMLRGSGWYVIDDCTLECGCGSSIEWDGACGACGPSPLRAMGVI
jgi:hypothetical protein